MKSLILALPLFFAPACGTLGVEEGEDGSTRIVSTETGETVPIGSVLGGVVGTATGNPGLGVAIGAAATALIAGFLKKRK